MKALFLASVLALALVPAFPVASAYFSHCYATPCVGTEGACEVFWEFGILGGSQGRLRERYCTTTTFTWSPYGWCSSCADSDATTRATRVLERCDPSGVSCSSIANLPVRACVSIRNADPSGSFTHHDHGTACADAVRGAAVARVTCSLCIITWDHPAGSDYLATGVARGVARDPADPATAHAASVAHLVYHVCC